MRLKESKSAAVIKSPNGIQQMEFKGREEDTNLMTGKQQKKQLKLPLNWERKGEAKTAPGEGTEPDVVACEPGIPVPESLMEEVASALNLKEAYLEVRANGGAPGIDGMTVNQLDDYIAKHREKLSQRLMDGTFVPRPVKRVEIEKPGGGTRKLGIPCVIDRLVQQAILRVVQRYTDDTFSESSFGFRPNRSAHDAIRTAQEYVRNGFTWVIDIDLEKFFDRVNHDILMSLVAKRFKDKRLLKLIRAFLNAGVMENGLVTEQEEGTPQGGPLSPWLSNVMLDELDKELEKRNLSFARYADDCNIYVQSERAGLRVMASITKFLSKKLRLTVNAQKSAVGRPWERKFLGFTFTRKELKIAVSPVALVRAKDRIRELTKRKRGGSKTEIFRELAQYLNGWRGYYEVAETKGTFQELDKWLRRRLRALLWHRWRTPKARYKELIKHGVSPTLAACTAGSSKGTWHLSLGQALSIALPISYFTDRGIPILAARRGT